MGRHLRLSLLLLSAAMLVQLPAAAQGFSLVGADGAPIVKKGRKNKIAVEESSEDRKSEMIPVYMFGVSFSFSDSIMYMTDVQRMDSVEVSGDFFMKDRNAYGNQLKYWLEKGGAPVQVPSLFFYKKQSQARKGISSVRKRALKKHKGTIITVPDFKFSHI